MDGVFGWVGTVADDKEKPDAPWRTHQQPLSAFRLLRAIPHLWDTSAPRVRNNSQIGRQPLPDNRYQLFI
jgi:hypothetical protein